MHPQIRQNEAGDCPICGMDLIPLAANTSNDPLVLEMTEAAAKLANIQTTIVGNTTDGTGKTFRLSGKVQADERLAASQVAHIPGRIEKLHVSFTGAQVNKGQKLAEIYSPELITAQGELLEALKLEKLNPSILEAARTKLRYWKISNESIQAIETSGKIQEVFSIFADESGIVTQRRVAVGDYVKQGESLFDLVNLQRVWVLFDAYEADLAHIALGDQIEFTTAALPQQKFSAKITFIDPAINPKTRVASLRTEVRNSNRALKPEMLVYGVLNKSTGNKNQMTIPKSAVLWTGTRSVVYEKLPDATVPSFRFKEIDLGDAIGDQYQVISGLELGEEIVTHGNFAIDAAAQLNNQASMMNRDVKIKGMGKLEMLPDYTTSTSTEFKDQLEQLLGQYLLLKEAFVATDSVQASQAAETFIAALGSVDMSQISGAAHTFWMAQLGALKVHAEQISNLRAVAAQRQQFGFLSDVLIKVIKVFGVSENTYYIQHCPMAFDDAGADWISSQKEIQNPYFGSAMLKCGTVETTIDKDYKRTTAE
jgi:Cu(I)/Ag(I) efflux system membrane fusion protein